MKKYLQVLYLKMNRVSKTITKFLEGVCALFMFICFLTLLLQVLYRMIIVKFVSFSFPFTEEFARYLLIWTVYLISGVNIREGSMVAINFIYDRVNITNKYSLFYVTKILSIIFVGVAFYYSLLIVGQNINFHSSTLQVPGLLLFSAPSVGMILIAYEVLTETIGVLSGFLSPFAGREISHEAQTESLTEGEN